jgi:hypothetical protein
MLFFVAWGFLVWAAAIVLLRLTGHYYLHPDHLYLSALTFLVTVPLIALLTWPVYDWRRVYPLDRPRAAIFLALPGMLGDIVVLLLFARVLPNLASGAWLFGAWTLWAYVLVLITGFVSISRLRRV